MPANILLTLLVRHPEELTTLSDLSRPPTTGSGYLFEVSLGLGQGSNDPIFLYLKFGRAL